MRTPRLRSGMPPGSVIGTPRGFGRGLRAPTIISQDAVAGGVVGATPGAGGSSGAGIPPVGANGTVLAVVTGAAAWTFTTLITGLGTIATGVWQGTLIALGFGGTGSNLSGTGGAHKFLRQNSVGANVDVVQPDFSDLASTLSTHLIASTNITLTGTDPVTIAASSGTGGTSDWDGPFVGAWGDGGWGEGGWADQWYNISGPPTRGRLLAADGPFPTLAPYWSNVGDNGLRLTYNGNLYATATAAPANFTTLSLTEVMGGYAIAFTPLTSGRCKLMATGAYNNNTANDGAQLNLRYGTGTAPTLGAAVTGTAVGTGAGQTFSSTGINVGWTCLGIVTLVVGTTYWLDISMEAVTGGTASCIAPAVVAMELP